MEFTKPKSYRLFYTPAEKYLLYLFDDIATIVSRTGMIYYYNTVLRKVLFAYYSHDTTLRYSYNEIYTVLQHEYNLSKSVMQSVIQKIFTDQYPSKPVYECLLIDDGVYMGWVEINRNLSV